MISTQSIRVATELAHSGYFLRSIELLGDRWPGVGIEPARDGESDLEYAHLLLLCGILSVEMGRFTMAPAQSSAKDLLSKAIRLFGDDDGLHEARFWLGVAYLRSGENNEALALVETILSEQIADSDVVFCATRLKGLALLNLGKLCQAKSAFAAVEIFLETVPALSRGKFYLSRGMLRRRMGLLDGALADYDLAAKCFRDVGSLRYEAAAQNNAARIYLERGLFSDAHAAARFALSRFVRLEDKAHEAKAWDEIAQIYGREENYPEMEQCALRAVEILSEGDHEGWLAEALITLGMARAKLGMKKAQESLLKALAICDRQSDHQQASTAMAVMWEIVQSGKQAQESFREVILSMERAVYERVLIKHGGRVSPAAHELGFNHQAFQLRLQTHFPGLIRLCRPPQRRHKRVSRIK